MLELAQHWPASSGPIELWGGGKLPFPSPPNYHHLRAISRDHWLLRGRPWSERYLYEQWSLLPRTIASLRFKRAAAVYCGDPVLTWHLKRFQSWHGAKVIFMNGTRMGATWCNHMDGVHLLTETYLAEAHQELGEPMRAKFFVAPHFVDVSRFTPANPEEKFAARRRWQLPEDKFVVLTVGPLSKVGGKRLDFLAREIASADIPAVFVHAGVSEGDAAEVQKEIQACLGERAIFLGPVDRKEIGNLYRAADTYALAALAEPFSIAILEALASGLPVVHHTFPVTTWITASGGCPVSMEQHGEAAQVFRNLYQLDGMRLRMAEAARREAESRFSPGPVAERIASSITAIAEGAPQ